MKNETRVQNLWLFEVFGHKSPKTSFQAPDSKFYRSRNKFSFHVKLHKILHKTSPYFQHLDIFWQSYVGLIPENWKKTHQNYSFWYHSRYVSSLKNYLSWRTKIRKLYMKSARQTEMFLETLILRIQLYIPAFLLWGERL